jgi:hypothetical protein
MKFTALMKQDKEKEDRNKKDAIPGSSNHRASIFDLTNTLRRSSIATKERVSSPSSIHQHVPLSPAAEALRKAKQEGEIAKALEVTMDYYKDRFGSPEYDDVLPMINKGDVPTSEGGGAEDPLAPDYSLPWWKVTVDEIETTAIKLGVDLTSTGDHSLVKNILWVLRMYAAEALHADLPDKWIKHSLGADAGGTTVHYSQEGWHLNQFIDLHPCHKYFSLLLTAVKKDIETSYLTPRTFNADYFRHARESDGIIETYNYDFVGKSKINIKEEVYIVDEHNWMNIWKIGSP